MFFLPLVDDEETTQPDVGDEAQNFFEEMGLAIPRPLWPEQ